MTNLDKIKQEVQVMTIEQICKYLDVYICSNIPSEHCVKYPITMIHNSCTLCKLDWLKSEVE